MFGICYYPEHWPQESWAQDARLMASLGLTYVRVGEFAWSRLEPRDGDLCFDWLDSAIGTLSSEGLKIILGTPTATPPKWLINKHPEILPADPATGHVRNFGSRRHYDFSSEIYLSESLRITKLVAERYGEHPSVAGWQTDNELCCHETAVSGSATALTAFRDWCRQRYQHIETLNSAWGNVFWSMEYLDFSEIELPFGAVTEVNPAHSLAYRRFSSDQVIRFHNRMVEVIRQYSPNKFVTHNFIPMNETGVDNFSVAKPLDFDSYDNYPLGRTDEHFGHLPAEQFRPYMRTGHPDFATYYHDQTRGLLNRDFWVMEQQPGPVNWAPNNPKPLPGMVRFWALEAFAHGASCVSYFRWRQAPFAQEQMHAGLLRPDNSKTEAWSQAEQVYKEVEQLDLANQQTAPARVAIISAVEGLWVSDIEQQASAYDFNKVQLSYYTALRELGLNIDFISADSDFSPYSVIVAPCLPILDEPLIEKCEHKCKESSAIFVFGPRTGAKTDEFGYPKTLPPGPLQRLVPLRVLSVETLRSDYSEPFSWNDKQYQSLIWREELDAAGAEVLAKYDDTAMTGPAIIRSGQIIYLGTLTDAQFLHDFFKNICAEIGITTHQFGNDIRVRQRGNLFFAFNYSDQEQLLPIDPNCNILIGDKRIKPYDVTIWKNQDIQI